VVANSAARIGTVAGWFDRAALVVAAGMDPVADSARGRWFTDAFAQRSPAVVDALVEGLRHTSPAAYAACCLALGAADLREAIRTISVPTLLVAGRHDPVTTVDDAVFMRERIARARCVTLDASHLSNIEAAETFTDQLRAFLT
jgi:pimeloyl-ACP methyl ester carboxylesterase